MNGFDIADVVKTYLDTLSLSMSITPLVDIPINDEEVNLIGVRASILPREVETELYSRASLEEVYTIDVAIQSKVGSNLMQDVRGLSSLVEEIKNSLAFTNLDGIDFKGIGVDPIVSLGHLEANIFTSVISVDYVKV